MTKEQTERLEKSELMLSQIASLVAEFCEDDKDTTLIGVANLLAQFRSLQSKDAWDFYDSLRRKSI